MQQWVANQFQLSITTPPVQVALPNTCRLGIAFATSGATQQAFVSPDITTANLGYGFVTGQYLNLMLLRKDWGPLVVSDWYGVGAGSSPVLIVFELYDLADPLAVDTQPASNNGKLIVPGTVASGEDANEEDRIAQLIQQLRQSVADAER